MMFPLMLSAQDAPVSVSFSPPEGWETGDEIEVTIDYGTQAEPVEDLLTVRFEIDMPEGTSIDRDASNLEVDASGTWFGSDGAWSGTAEAVNGGTQLVVSLARTNETPVSGYGEVARVKGLSVVIEEIFLKSFGPGAISIDHAEYQKIGMSLDQGIVSGVDAPETAVVEVYDASGRMLASGRAQEGIAITPFPNQILFVRLQNNGNYLNHRSFFVVE